MKNEMRDIILDVFGEVKDERYGKTVEVGLFAKVMICMDRYAASTRMQQGWVDVDKAGVHEAEDGFYIIDNSVELYLQQMIRGQKFHWSTVKYCKINLRTPLLKSKI